MVCWHLSFYTGITILLIVMDISSLDGYTSAICSLLLNLPNLPTWQKYVLRRSFLSYRLQDCALTALFNA